MRRKIVGAALAVMLTFGAAAFQHTSAQGGCQAFGQDTSAAAQTYKRGFGAATAANPDVIGFVRGLHNALCSEP